SKQSSVLAQVSRRPRNEECFARLPRAAPTAFLDSIRQRREQRFPRTVKTAVRAPSDLDERRNGLEAGQPARTRTAVTEALDPVEQLRGDRGRGGRIPAKAQDVSRSLEFAPLKSRRSGFQRPFEQRERCHEAGCQRHVTKLHRERISGLYQQPQHRAAGAAPGAANMYPKVSSAARRGSPPTRHASSSAGRASEPNDATNACALRLVWLPSSTMPRSDLASLYRSTVSTSWIRYSPYPSPPSRSSGRSASRSSNLNNL